MGSAPCQAGANIQGSNIVHYYNKVHKVVNGAKHLGLSTLH